MAKIILLCGKICSGKSTYANQIKQKYNAVVLSCDELMLALFEEQLGDRHNIILNKVKDYIYQLAEQIAATNTDVILDFGFWTRTEREKVRSYFNSKGIKTELHYIRVSPEVWLSNMERRNESLHNGGMKSYYIDETMKQLLSEQFQEPDSDEIDILFDSK
ncbi:MAG TPA: ATP-binding protein [Clostridia bacterium]|nr:ATP-binding protein [Clostridia bacterium]